MIISRTPIFLTLFALLLFGASCKKESLNKQPTADAGPSQTVTYPVESVTLTGNATDADGKIVTYRWEQVSGHSASVIVDPGSPTTVVEGLVKGTYVFQLSVWDNLGGIGTDTTVITVNPGSGTLTLQPANNPGEFSLCEIGGVDQSAVPPMRIDLLGWTRFGASYTCRALLKFDLSTLTSSSTIKSAHLYLYSDPAPLSGNQHDANYGNNAFTIQQVAADWSPSTAGWFNQPTGLTNNQILVPSTTLPFLDMNIDVTAQVASMVNENRNYGFLLKLQSEAIYVSRMLVGSTTQTYPDKRPKLVVEYQ